MARTFSLRFSFIKKAINKFKSSRTPKKEDETYTYSIFTRSSKLGGCIINYGKDRYKILHSHVEVIGRGRRIGSIRGFRHLAIKL